MALIPEVAVRVRLVLRRDETGDHALARAASLTADGVTIRSDERDITDQLSPTLQAKVTDLLDRAETYYRTRWEVT